MTAILAGVIGAATLTACSTAPKTSTDRRAMVRQAESLIEEYKSIDPGMRTFFEDSYAYAVFPSVGKGGLIVGGSYGRGAVYQLGDFVGYADVTSGTFGLQAGAEGFSEVLFFENRGAFRDFTNGKFTLSAQASAVMVDSGAAAKTRYSNGVAIFIRGQSGLMAELSLGGQGFSYESKYAFVEPD